MKRVETAIVENTGGWVMIAFGKLTTGEWFAASLDSDIISLYDNEQDAYDCDGVSGFIRDIYKEDEEYKPIMMEIIEVADDPWGVLKGYSMEMEDE